LNPETAIAVEFRNPIHVRDILGKFVAQRNDLVADEKRSERLAKTWGLDPAAGGLRTAVPPCARIRACGSFTPRRSASPNPWSAQ
jgi:hypothetical protein